MKPDHLALLALCAACLTIGGCATDGGIVGTGNRVDCEPKTRPDGTRPPLPEECKRQARETR